MAYYSKTPLDDRYMTYMSGETCYGYGTGASHERIILGAGGEIGRDGFMDPRPGHSGEMIADRVFINQKTNQIQGINFSRNGEFCCSYTGMCYSDIKESNRMDCEDKRKAEQSTEKTTESKTLQKQREERINNSQTQAEEQSIFGTREQTNINKIKH